MWLGIKAEKTAPDFNTGAGLELLKAKSAAQPWQSSASSNKLALALSTRVARRTSCPLSCTVDQDELHGSRR